MREWKTRDGRKVTLENPKETDTHYLIHCSRKTWYILPVPLLRLQNDLYCVGWGVKLYTLTINSALRHQCRYVIQLKIIVILITTFCTVFALKINHTVSVTPHITFPGSYSATGVTNWATQHTTTWLNCFFWFVSLAIQRLPYFLNFFIPIFSSPAFSTPALYQRRLNTQHCILLWLCVYLP